MRDYIERLRAKPEHIRRRIALGTTLGITGVVTAVWFFTLLFTGSFSLAIPSSAVNSNSNGSLAQADIDTSGSAASDAASQMPSNLSSLLGAVGLSTAKPAPATLQIEDAAPAAATTTAQPTVIPF